VPYRAAFPALSIPGVGGNTPNVTLESLRDLAPGFVDFVDDRIRSFGHRLPQ